MTMETAEVFSEIQLLATGGYGKVFSATEELWEGKTKSSREVVIKSMDRLHQSYVRMSAFREVFILRRLQWSPNVIKLLSSYAFVDAENGDVTSIHLTLEKMDMDVALLLHQAKRGRAGFGVRWSDAAWSENGRYVVHQLLCALRDVHSINAVHRDIKPGNVLVKVDFDTGRPYQVKLADFGLARPLDTSYSHDGYLTNAVSTRWYRAPELLLGKSSYGNAVDLWSVGCVFAEFLLKGTTLFPGANDTDQLQRVCHMLAIPYEEAIALPHTNNIPYDMAALRQMLPPHITQLEFSLLESLLEFDSTKRPSASEALSHPYFSSLDSADTPDSHATARALHIEDESLCLLAKTKSGFMDALSYEDIDFREALPTNKCAVLSHSDPWTSFDEDPSSGGDTTDSEEWKP